ncbi:hypothetical protein [Nocardia blacklockiae]|uniref:hypothetical protein n=1 Tax=Nocardia blacklockiae TaxID=480036 RepID=UPI00189455A6|nr:hypothetical protein [Nocardia blacklockiae]MBF6176057.1 hypothetical protein [Nocardia blacklockiae]
MPRNSTTETDHGWGWLADTLASHPPCAPERRGTEWAWLATAPPRAGSEPRHRLGLPRRTRFVVAVIAAAAATLIFATVLTSTEAGQRRADPVQTAMPPTSTAASAGADACAGLSGPVVTDGAGDTSTVAGTIAGFEHAYYRLRSAADAMRLLAPETGIAAEPLAAGIASVPTGTTHCVAITPLTDTTAAVHLVELHPDRQRIDYLQVINTRPADGGALMITNIQTAG